MMQDVLSFIINHPVICTLIYLNIGILFYWGCCYFNRYAYHEGLLVILWPLAAVIFLAVLIITGISEGINILFRPIKDIGWK